MGTVTVNGAVSGIDTTNGNNDVINKLEIVYLLNGTDDAGRTDLTNQTNLANSAAAAQAAGRGFNLVRGTNDAGITAYQGTGYSTTANLAAGTYTFAVRVTEQRADSSLVSGAWTKGNSINVAGATTTTTTAAPGSVSFTYNTLLGTNAAITTPGGAVAIRFSSPTALQAASIVDTVGITKATHIVTTLFQVTAFPADSTHWPSFMPILLSAAASLPANRNAAFTPNQAASIVFQSKGSGYYVNLCYCDSTNGAVYWNGTSWVTTAPDGVATGLALNTTYQAILETTATQFRLTLKNSDGSSILCQSPWVDWTAVANIPAAPYLLIDLYNSLGGACTADVLSSTIS